MTSFKSIFKMMGVRRYEVVLWLLLLYPLSAKGYTSEFGKEMCGELQSNYQQLRDGLESRGFSTSRYVDPSVGVDNASCLMSSDGNAPCKTVNYAMEQDNDTTAGRAQDISITLLSGEHHLPFRLLITDSSYIRIRGLDPSTTFITCTKFPNMDLPCSFDGVDLQRSTKIWISNITFTRCGPIPVAFFMEDLSDIILEDCIFEGNLASPILALDMDNAYLVRNTFRDNHLAPLNDNVTQFPCTRIKRELFFLSSVRTAGAISMIVSHKPMHFFVWQNMFQNNSAQPNLMEDSLPERVRPLGRGGAMAVRLVNASNSHMCIKDSEFLGNRAETAAGAISFSGARFTKDYSVTLWNTLLEDNRCEAEMCIGGGLHVQTDGLENEFDRIAISIYDSVFRRNTAGIGAGFIGFTCTLQSFYYLQNDTFEDNTGRFEGGVIAVLNLADFTMPRTRLWLTDCYFLGNTGFVDNRLRTVNVPPVYTYHAVVTVSGTITFSSNNGGGLSVNQGILNVAGQVLFSDNVALHGGGLKLIDRAELFVSKGSTLRFLNNKALQAGGAIFATNTALDYTYVLLDYTYVLLNIRCFLQYNSTLGADIAPDEWENITIIFQGNEATGNLGDDIFATDFRDCVYLIPEGSTVDYPNDTTASIFNAPPNYTSPIHYLDENGNRVTEVELVNKRISSGLVRITINPQTLYVALGDKAEFEISGFDEVGDSASAVFLTETDLDVPSLGSTTTARDIFAFRVSGEGLGSNLSEQCSLAQQEGRLCTDTLEVNITFIVQQTTLIETRTVVIYQCHPGYTYNSTVDTCVCQNRDFYEVLRCTSDNKYFYVQDGIWIGFFFNNTMFSSSVVPLTYLNCTSQVASGGQSSLPGCLVRFDRPEEQCAEGREGLLCAMCDADRGYGITMDLTRCTKDCSAGGAILFVLICVATIIGCVVVLYCNIGIPNELRGFFLYAQVIGLVYRHTTAISARELGTGFVDFIANMLGTSLPFPVCISPYITTTWMTVLGYVPPALAVITVLVFVISARYVSRLANRSTLSGITLISLFVYKYITDVSFVLMNCTNLPDTPSTKNLWLNRFSGEMCFQLPHVFWLVVALLLTFTVIFPIPFFVLVINLKQFNKMKHFSDALSNGMGRHRGFYSAWDLFRRLYFVLIAVWLPAILLPNRLLALLLFEVVMLVVHCLSKPYQKKWINVVEALILLDLFVATAAILQSSDRYITHGLIVLLVVLPYLYAIPMVGFLTGKYLWVNALNDKWRERTTVHFSPVITWHSKLRTSWHSNMRPSSPSNAKGEERSPEPKASSNLMTSTFYVPTNGNSAMATGSSYEGSFSYRSNTGDPDLLQYRVNALNDKWRERTTVHFFLVIAWHSKLRTSWHSEMRPSSPSNTKDEERLPEPKASSNQMTSTFYIPNTGDSAMATDSTYEGSFSYRSNTRDPELLQYRSDLRQE